MSDPSTHETGLDTQAAELGFGKGGVPWFLMVFYLAFLTFFVWYTLEYQLPDFLKQGPVKPGGTEATAPAPR